MRILVSDPLADIGIQIFKNTPDIEVDVKTDLSPSELEEIIGVYHGLSIRSKTKVTGEMLARATNLKVIGRAGKFITRPWGLSGSAILGPLLPTGPWG